MTIEQFKNGAGEALWQVMREQIPEVDQDTQRLMFLTVTAMMQEHTDLDKRIAALEKRHAEEDAELAKTAGVDHG